MKLTRKIGIHCQKFGRMAVCLALGSIVPAAMAQPGTLVRNVLLPVSGEGVSVGVDCDGNVYYTVANDTNLYKMDKNGVLLDTIPITDSATGEGLLMDEMAWDNTRQVFWAQLNGSPPGPSLVDIYQLDPTTGVATFAFTSATNSLGTFRDGIAFDASDDSLWISGDVSTTIEHHRTDGTFINAITPKDGAGDPLGSISGVSVGVGDQLYLGRNGAVEIVRVKKSNGDFISSFASPGGARDEGLECDAINFAPKLVLWSREFFSPGFISVIEIEPGTCACGGAQGKPTLVLRTGDVCFEDQVCSDDSANAGDPCDDDSDCLNGGGPNGNGIHPECVPGKVVVRVDMEGVGGLDPIKGGEFFIGYDPTQLFLNESDPGSVVPGDSPFTQQVFELFPPGNTRDGIPIGSIDYAVSVPLFTNGTNADTTMARIVFDIAPGADACESAATVFFRLRSRVCTDGADNDGADCVVDADCPNGRCALAPPTKISSDAQSLIQPNLVDLSEITIASEPPTTEIMAENIQVDDTCNGIVEFWATITDDCCIRAEDVRVDVELIGGFGDCFKCITNEHCGGPTPVCDTDTELCVQCLDDLDCFDGQACDQGVCIEQKACDSPGTCAAGFVECGDDFACFCATRPDGTGACHRSIGCAGRVECPNGDSDCPPDGSKCFVDTCCEVPICAFNCGEDSLLAAESQAGELTTTGVRGQRNRGGEAELELIDVVATSARRPSAKLRRRSGAAGRSVIDDIRGPNADALGGVRGVVCPARILPMRPFQVVEVDQCVGGANDGLECDLNDESTCPKGTCTSKVMVHGQVMVNKLTDCPAQIQITVNATDCCGDEADPVVVIVDVTDKIAPVITGGAEDIDLSRDDCDGEIHFTGLITDNCCIRTENDGVATVSFDVSILGGTKGPVRSGVGEEDGALRWNVFVPVSDVDCEAEVWVTINARDCCDVESSETFHARAIDVTPPVVVSFSASDTKIVEVDPVSGECNGRIEWEAIVRDACCLGNQKLSALVSGECGEFDDMPVITETVELGPDELLLRGFVLLKRVTCCETSATLVLSAQDCCGNEALVCSDGSGGRFPQTLFGIVNASVDGPSLLLILDPADGSIVDVVGFVNSQVVGLAVDPTTGILYGSTKRFADNFPGFLITIDKATGEATPIGEIDPDRTAAGLTFTSDGTLFGWLHSRNRGDDLITINKVTGEGTVVGGPSGLTNSTLQAGLAASEADTLFLTGTGDTFNGDPKDVDPLVDKGLLHTIDRSTGVVSSATPLTGGSGGSRQINSLAFDCDQTLFGNRFRADDTGSLITIDTATGAITVLGPKIARLKAIAFDVSCEQFRPCTDDSDCPGGTCGLPSATANVLNNVPPVFACPCDLTGPNAVVCESDIPAPAGNRNEFLKLECDAGPSVGEPCKTDEDCLGGSCVATDPCAVAEGGCGAAVIVEHLGTDRGATSCPTFFTRTYQATSCDVVNTCVQLIEVTEQIPPEISNFSVTLENDGKVDENCTEKVTVTATISDNCDLDSVTVTVTTVDASADFNQDRDCTLVGENPADLTCMFDVFLSACPASVSVRVDALDGCGNSAIPATGEESLTDNIAPEITCPPDLVGDFAIECDASRLPGDLAVCQGSVNPAINGKPCSGDADCEDGRCADAIATASDNCTVEKFVDSTDNTDDLGPCSDLGIITRTWTAVDDCGNVSTCDQLIEIVDTTGPLFKGCNDIKENSDGGLRPGDDDCGALLALGDSCTAADNCPEPGVPALVPPATTMVEYDIATADAAVANNVNKAFEDPNVTASNMTAVGLTGPFSFAQTFCWLDWPVGGSLNPNQYYQFSVTPDPGSQIEYTTLDLAVASGPGGTGTFELHASLDGFAGSDITLTVLNFPNDATWHPFNNVDISALGTQKNTVNFRFYMYNVPSGAFSGLGVNPNFGPQGQNFFINGIITPQIPVPVILIRGDCPNGPFDTFVGVVDEFPVGETCVQASATDCAGNTSTVVFRVRINDNEAPTANCPDDKLDFKKRPDECFAVLDFEATADDNCPDPSITCRFRGCLIEKGAGSQPGDRCDDDNDCEPPFVCVDGAGPIATSPITVEVGSPVKVTCVADDGSPDSQNDTCMFTYGVIDNSDPTAKCPADIFEPAAGIVEICDGGERAGESCTRDHLFVGNFDPPDCPGGVCVLLDGCEAFVCFEPTAQDNCPGVFIECDTDCGIFTGENIVRCWATDAAGNEAHCEFLITITDLIQPDIRCPDEVVVSADAGTCNAFVVLDGVFATDNCLDPFPEENLTCVDQDTGAPILRDGHKFDGGVTNVECTATDGLNDSMCKFQVIVLPTSAMDVEVFVEGLTNPVSRCVSFTLVECGTDPLITTVVEAVLDFVSLVEPGLRCDENDCKALGSVCDLEAGTPTCIPGAIGFAKLDVECGDWSCVSAKDELHTLRRTKFVDTDPQDATRFLASFLAQARLKCGDATNDNLVDIEDFTRVGALQTVVGEEIGGDTDCDQTPPDEPPDFLPLHPDFDGDGAVNFVDFICPSDNFLQPDGFGDEVDQCCPGGLSPAFASESGLASRLRSSVSVVEMSRRMGAQAAQAADLDGNGVIDLRDVVQFAAEHGVTLSQRIRDLAQAQADDQVRRNDEVGVGRGR